MPGASRSRNRLASAQEIPHRGGEQQHHQRRDREEQDNDEQKAALVDSGPTAAPGGSQGVGGGVLERGEGMVTRADLHLPSVEGTTTGVPANVPAYGLGFDETSMRAVRLGTKPVPP